jgi:hypothetical protein
MHMHEMRYAGHRARQFTTLQQLVDAERRDGESNLATLSRLAHDRARTRRLAKKSLMGPSLGRIWLPPVGQDGGHWHISDDVVEELFSYVGKVPLPDMVD